MNTQIITPLQKPLVLLNISVFLKSHLFLLPVLFLFYQQHGITAGDFFLFQGVHALACLALEIPCGYLADLYSKKKILILSSILLFCRFALLFLFPNFWVILCSEILFAVVLTTFNGTVDSYIFEWLKMNNKTPAMLKRYGKLYFYIAWGSAISSLAGAWLFSKYGSDLVLLLTMGYVLLSTVLLFFLPEVPRSHAKIKGIRAKYSDLVTAVKRITKQPHIHNLMLFSALLGATYQFFQWSFQPLMKQTLFPIFLFGVVFFTTSVCRAIGSKTAHQIVQKISINTLGNIVCIGFILSFIGAACMLYTDLLAIHIAVLFFICACIGAQTAFAVTAITQIHQSTTSSERATWSSVNNMYGRLAMAVCMILSKIVLDGCSIQMNMLVFCSLFIVMLIPLSYLIRKTNEK